MEHHNSFRTQLSFLVSIVLHSAFVAMLALGPFLMSSKTDTDAAKQTVSETGQPLEISVVDTTPPPAQTQEMLPPPTEVTPVKPAISVKPAKSNATEVAIVAKEPAAHPTPHVEKKPAKKPVVAKATVTKSTVAKTTKKLAPQPLLEAENTETPLEKAAVEEQVPEQKEEATTDESLVAVAQTAPAEQEPAKETVTKEQTKEVTKVASAAPLEDEENEEAPAAAADTEFTGDKSTQTPATAPVVEEAPKAVEQAPLPPPTIKSQKPTASLEQPATSASNSSAQPAEAVAASSATGLAVTQSYTGLKQMNGNKPPAYSREMRRSKMEGVGQLVYYVGKDGSVSQMRLTKSTGYTDLDQAAIDAFSKYKFVPGQAGYTVHNFEFSLKGPAVSDEGRLRTSMSN